MASLDENLDSRPLAGVRVLDLTRLLPGPLASLALADMGATVDKLEDPGAGDYLRHMPPSRDGLNGAFVTLNRDKRGGILDLKHPLGPPTLLRLCRAYDVLIESFRPGVLARLGLSHQTLCEANSRLIVCAITGYGQTGPLAHRAGHDLNYLARAGVLGVTGPSGGPPSVSGAQIADVAGGALWAVSAISAALYARERTGKGRVIDIAMSEGALPVAAFALSGVLAADDRTPRGEGYLDGGLAPYRCYQTSDGGYVALAALEPKFWLQFCSEVSIEPSMEALVPGPHQVALIARLEALFATRTRDAWAAVGAQRDCCLEPVLRPDELTRDAHLSARSVFFERDGQVLFRTPLASLDGELAHGTSAPRAGQDTREIWADAGFSAAEIDTLLQDGVVSE
ncbi:MAG: CaiB/BaiF CoA-transferase family protein [Deltaproteobacteria bacterium]|nr:CaiB/BaiF CoA-transferase family protein [Deltaproteobacteria bacterium]